MKGKIIGIAVIVIALAAGIGGALVVANLLPKNTELAQYPFYENDQNPYSQQNGLNEFRGGMMGRNGNSGRMPGYGFSDNNRINLSRLTIDEAQSKAEQFAVSIGKNLHVAEVMEFSNNFYAVVVETDTKKAAFELLVDPYTGQVTQEMGGGMMWNQKYGRMGTFDNPSNVNPISITDAASKAQAVLDTEIPGAIVQKDGFDFYGYYSFDYEVNGKVAGMLSVNGETGQVFLHFWHDQFISEKEY